MNERREPSSILRRRCAWAANPVPAGIRRPTMTFSFKPRRSSFRPRTAASVRTRVVSWNEAAEMKDSVASDALVMPRRTGCRVALPLPSCSVRSLMSSARERSSCSPRSRPVSPEAATSVLRSIWNDHLDVLVVDLHALKAIDVLNLAHEIVRQRLDALQTQDVVGVELAVRDHLAP